jgi:DNA-nicking Smr family endonuclease
LKRKTRFINSDENDLWNQIVAEINPLDGKEKRRFIDLKTTASDTPLKIKKDFKPPDRNRNFDVRGTNDQNKNIDKKVFSKLKKGLLKPEATLDLHGMSFDKANKAVLDFVLISSNKNLRLILIISGKGQERNTTDNFFLENNSGTLKKSLPNWLSSSQLKSLVLNFTTAHISHGGEGAYYVYLRRNRSYKT